LLRETTKKAGRMLTPVEMNRVVLLGSGGNDWWEDWSRLVILDADMIKELPLIKERL
jgi:hypothetical protein